MDLIELSTFPFNSGYLGLFWTTLCKNKIFTSITVAKQASKDPKNAPKGLICSFHKKCYFCVLILPIIFHAHLKKWKLTQKLHLLGDQRVWDRMTWDQIFWAQFHYNLPLFHYIWNQKSLDATNKHAEWSHLWTVVFPNIEPFHLLIGQILWQQK